MEEGADQGDAVGASSRKLARSSSSGRHGRPGQRSCKACGVTRLPSGYNEVSRGGWLWGMWLQRVASAVLP